MVPKTITFNEETYTVTSVGANPQGFYCCGNLTSIVLPNSITSIGESAFYDCQKLKSVNLPSNLTSLGEGAFWGCKAITGITITGGVDNIPANAFNNVTDLTDL